MVDTRLDIHLTDADVVLVKDSASMQEWKEIVFIQFNVYEKLIHYLKQDFKANSFYYSCFFKSLKTHFLLHEGRHERNKVEMKDFALAIAILESIRMFHLQLTVKDHGLGIARLAAHGEWIKRTQFTEDLLICLMQACIEFNVRRTAIGSAP